MIKKIIFSSGGTGGHIFPALNLMEHFSKRGYQVVLVTDPRGSNFLQDNYNYKSYIIKTDTPFNKNFLEKIIVFFKIINSIFKSILILKKEKPNLIIGFGGYVSFPISFMSKFFNIPLVIYENNIIMGKTNKRLLPLSKKILLGTKIIDDNIQKYEHKLHVVGNILKKELLNFSKKQKIKNNKTFSILILGGSQGAEIFGKIIPKTIKMLKDKGFDIEINQQCIKDQNDSLIKYYDKHSIKNNIFNFIPNLTDLYSLTDLAITRCGASSTAELLYTQTPFIAVPYPHAADNHQYLNAKYYENKGCCWVVKQDNFNETSLFDLIKNIFEEKNKLKNVQSKMKDNITYNVYNKIENLIKEFF